MGGEPRESVRADWAILWKDLWGICEECALVFYFLLALAFIKWMSVTFLFPPMIDKIAVTAFGWSGCGVYFSVAIRSAMRSLARDFRKIVAQLKDKLKGGAGALAPGEGAADEGVSTFHMLGTQFVFTVVVCSLVAGLERVIQWSGISPELQEFVLVVHELTTVAMLLFFAAKVFFELALVPISAIVPRRTQV